eukprot:161920-Amphidinium_carterae.1
MFALAGDDEAVAGLSILLMKANGQIGFLGVSCVVNVTDKPCIATNSSVLEDTLRTVQSAQAVIILLSRRSLDLSFQVFGDSHVIWCKPKCKRAGASKQRQLSYTSTPCFLMGRLCHNE